MKKGQICTDDNCNEKAVIDYNGHGAFAGQHHYDKWTRIFEEEYR